MEITFSVWESAAFSLEDCANTERQMAAVNKYAQSFIGICPSLKLHNSFKEANLALWQQGMAEVQCLETFG
jgi:hypothetical protein